jgi:hypothetical protein
MAAEPGKPGGKTTDFRNPPVQVRPVAAGTLARRGKVNGPVLDRPVRRVLAGRVNKRSVVIGVAASRNGTCNGSNGKYIPDQAHRFFLVSKAANGREKEGSMPLM